MVPNPFMSVVMETAKQIVQVDCPVDGKGFSSIIVRTNSTNTAASISTISGVPFSNFFAFSGTPVHLRFNGGDNTVPKTLYFQNLSSSTNIITIFIEEVGSNPV